MEPSPIPMVILAGSDRRPSHLPPEGRDQHSLTGYKGMDIRVGGQPLLARILERLRETGQFEPIWVAGPARVYGEVGALVIDTDGPVHVNLQKAIGRAERECPGRPVAFMACDVLPERDELKRLLADYRQQGECDAWFPLVRAPARPEELGASAWKPEYQLIPEEGATAVPVLPGHLGVLDLSALRISFLLRLMAIAYRTRNRSVRIRSRAMAVEIFGSLIHEDLHHAVTLRAPSLTWNVLYHGQRVARGLRHGNLSLSDLEASVSKVLVHSRHRRRHPERGIRIPILDALSLAEDVDTEEEAQELERRWEKSQNGALPPPGEGHRDSD